LPATAVLTDMSSPLGLAVGNALEVREAIDVLGGGGPAEVRELSLTLASQMILMGGLTRDAEEAERQARRSMDSGEALAVFRRFVEAQGGDPAVVDRPDLLPAALVKAAVPAPSSGFVVDIDALAVGLIATGLGAGRRRVGEKVDPSVGIEIIAPRGRKVVAGDELAIVHAANDTAADEAVTRLSRAFTVSDEEPPPFGRLIEILGEPPE
jgi:pyrimidine-nucleoside phosphorylase